MHSVVTTLILFACVLFSYVDAGTVFSHGPADDLDENTLSVHTSIRTDASADPGAFIKPLTTPVTAVERPVDSPTLLAGEDGATRARYSKPQTSAARDSFGVPGSSSMRRAILHVYRL